MMSIKLIFLCALFTIAAIAETKAGSFDGRWQVTLETPEYTDPTGMVARGYTLEFPAEVKDGGLHGDRAIRGQPGWLQIEGAIRANGDAMLQVNGIVNRPEYALTHAETGHAYKYAVKAHFDGGRGSGTRIGGRISRFTFVRQ